MAKQEDQYRKDCVQNIIDKKCYVLEILEKGNPGICKELSKGLKAVNEGAKSIKIAVENTTTEEDIKQGVMRVKAKIGEDKGGYGET